MRFPGKLQKMYNNSSDREIIDTIWTRQINRILYFTMTANTTNKLNISTIFSRHFYVSQNLQLKSHITWQFIDDYSEECFHSTNEDALLSYAPSYSHNYRNQMAVRWVAQVVVTEALIVTPEYSLYRIRIPILWYNAHTFLISYCKRN